MSRPMSHESRPPLRLLVALACLACCDAHPAFAAPITLEFDAISGEAPVYVEQGFELRSDAPIEAASEGDPAPSLDGSAPGQSFELIALDGRSFDLLGFRWAESDSNAGPQRLLLQGEKPGGGVVQLAWVSDGVPGWETCTPGPRFAELRAVRWVSEGSLHFDHFEVSSALEFTRLGAGGRSYLEDGLLLRSTELLDAVPTGESGTPAVGGPGLGQVQRLTPVDGGTFAALGVRMRARLVPGSVGVEFVGTLADGSTISTSFATADAALVFEQFDFPPEFTSLVELRWSDAPDLLLDAFDVQFTPGMSLLVRSRHAGTAAVFNLPNGNGRRLEEAFAWNGTVGAAPGAVDASIDVFAFAPGGTPAAGVQLALRASGGGVAWCTDGDLFDTLTAADGFASFGGALRAGGATDPASGERAEIHVPASPGARVGYDARLVASRNDGALFTVDLTTGFATPRCVGTLPAGATEIEFDPRTGTVWVQPPGLGFVVEPYALDTCSVSGPAIDVGAAMNGLEFIGDELYGVGITGPCAASSLYRIDVDAGTTTLVGATGLDVPIAGLAFDPASGLVYGVTGCTSASGSDLVTVDLATGEALVVGSLGVALGSIALGPDGVLYGVGNNQNGGNFYRIDPVSASVALVGNTGTAGLTGLALVSDRGLDLQFNSADLDGDLDVDLADVGQFSIDLSAFVGGAPAAFRSDYFWNGQLNLQDIGSLGTGIGTACAVAPFAAKGTSLDHLEGSTLGLWFDDELDAREVRANAGSVLTVRLGLRGPLAREGIRAWGAAVRTTPNLEILTWSLPDESIDLGRGDAHVVGTGVARASTDGALVLATLSVRVRDEEPGYLFLEGVPDATHGARLPAVAGLLDRDPRTVGSAEGAVAAINGVLEIDDTAPAAFRGFELRNVPNPFNPATEIRFALPARGQVELRIYDLAGRRVRSLQAGMLEAGARGVVWDGRDERGRPVTSGVYLARLRVDDALAGEGIKLVLIE